MEQIIYKCGHIDPDYYPESVRHLKILEAKNQNCWKCSNNLAEQQGLTLDARTGSYTTKLTYGEIVISRDNSHTDYAPNENVHDGVRIIQTSSPISLDL